MLACSVGDSHSDWTFRGRNDVNRVWLGPWTMHRLGRDREMLSFSNGVPYDVPVVLCLGEIDVRCHVTKQAAKHADGVTGVLTDLVAAYEPAVLANAADGRWRKTVVMSVVPPTSSSRWDCHNPDFPFIGTDAERVASTVQLNGMLREMCARNGWLYLDVHRLYVGPDGMLPLERSDGNVHVGDPDPALDALKELLAG